MLACKGVFGKATELTFLTNFGTFQPISQKLVMRKFYMSRLHLGSME